MLFLTIKSGDALKSWVVLKFGGTSVSSKEKWQIITDVVARRIKQGHQVMLVHSAAQGLTDILTKKISQNQSVLKAFTEKVLAFAAKLNVNQSVIEKIWTD